MQSLQTVPVWTIQNTLESPCPYEMPNQINILGQRFRIKYHSNIFGAPKEKTSLDGIVIFSHRLIIIDANLTLHEMRETLYHEVCHIYLKTRQTQDDRLIHIEDKEIEGFCDLFGEAIVDLALNNPLPK